MIANKHLDRLKVTKQVTALKTYSRNARALLRLLLRSKLCTCNSGLTLIRLLFNLHRSSLRFLSTSKL